jgi:hypothetical protein
MLPFAVLGSFLAVLVLIAVVRTVFPGVLRDGFRDVACIGVRCAEGEFCQANACKKINPPYTNNYFAEGFEDEPAEEEKKEKEPEAEAFRNYF